MLICLCDCVGFVHTEYVLITRTVNQRFYLGFKKVLGRESERKLQIFDDQAVSLIVSFIAPAHTALSAF